MQKQWEDLQALHDALETREIANIEAKTWLSTIQECLSHGPVSEDTMCCLMPAECYHCHQLSALSVITTLRMITKETEALTLEKTLLRPLCLPDSSVLHKMDPEEQQTTKWVVQNITASCIRIIQEHCTDPAFCHEPLQLLCDLLSKRCGDVTTISACLQNLESQMPALYQNCCLNLNQSMQGLLKRFGSDSCLAENNSDPSNVATLQSNAGTEQTICYLFLRLMQKVVKCANLVKPLDGSEHFSFGILSKGVLKPLVATIVPWFGPDRCKKSSYLIEKKCLDILDIFFNYMEIRTNYVLPTYHQEVAETFMLVFEQSYCSWDFRSEHLFIGGCVGEGKKRNTSDGSNTAAGEDEDLDESEADHFSPILMLLLAIVLKSSASLLKTSNKDEVIQGCVRVLLSTHKCLHERFSEDVSIQACAASNTAHSEGLCTIHLDWLPQVCGEQDDRWIEALLCLLDIFLSLQFCKGSVEISPETASLMALLDPHWLLLQLLHEINFDCSLIIDWLTSPETCFLAYLTQYLKLVVSDFFTLSTAAHEWDSDPGLSEERFFETGTLDCFDISSNGEEEIEPEANDESAAAEQTVETSDTVAADKNGEEKGVGFFGKSAKTNEMNVDEIAEAVDKCATLPCTQNVGARGFLQSAFPFAEISASNRLEPGSVEMHTVFADRDHGVGDSISSVCVECSVGLSLLSCYGEDEDSDADYGDGSKVNYCKSAILGSKSLADEVKETVSESILVDQGASGIQNERKSTSDLSELQLSTESLNRRKFSAGESNDGILLPDSLGRVMQLLSDVGERMQRLFRNDLLVYNPKPLISLIRQCEMYHRKE